MPKISIIHPSRQRAPYCAKTAKAWLSSAKNPENIEYIVSLDHDDIITAYEAHLGGLKYDIGITVNGNTNAVQAVNIAAKACTGDLLIVVSDDFNLPPYHWDEYLLTQLSGKSDYIVKTDDGSQPWIITLPIMDRFYYERFGYVYNPSYSHMFCDTELTCVADILGRKIILPILFKHNHYTTGNFIKDMVSQKADMTWQQGEELYLSRLKQNFGLTGGNIQCDESHKEWLKTKGVIL